MVEDLQEFYSNSEREHWFLILWNNYYLMLKKSVDFKNAMVFG